MSDQPTPIIVSDDQHRAFNRDGFVVVPEILDQAWLPSLHNAFDQLFNGSFETGTAPDEVNWQTATGDPELTRQICNGWKADRVLATVALDQHIGAAIAQLGDWPGARLIQDNLLWKPPGAGSVGFHQDNAYLAWYTPQQMLSCWITLDDIREDGGTLELARGSHRWPQTLDQTSDPTAQASDGFHNPDDYQSALRRCAAGHDVELEVVKIHVPRGGGVFHHGWTWHGSDINRSDVDRRAFVIHAASSEARFVPSAFASGNGPVYSRYRALGSDTMSEDHFPILWRNDGYRTPGIDVFLQQSV